MRQDTGHGTAADFQTLSYGRDAHDSGRARTVSGLSIGVGDAPRKPRSLARERLRQRARESVRTRAQTSAPREAQETDRQQASPPLDAERMQAIAQEAKLAFYKEQGAAKAREAFAQAEARGAMEAERVRAEAERERLAEEQLLKEQNREREVMRQRSHDHGHER
jgi:hypothetical protein